MEGSHSLLIDIGDDAIYAFIGYLVMIIAVGIMAARFSSKGIANFFIGGRKMNMFVVALSAVVSGRSAWLLLGFTGMAYKLGMSAMWASAGYIIAEFFLFFYFAPRIRRFSESTDCITIPDFFEERFADRTGLLRGLVSVIIIIFMVAYVSAQFVAGGKTFSAGFEITPDQGILLTAAIILFYTIIGGFLAVSITDTIQGVIMIFALIILPVSAILHLGGFEEFFSMARNVDPAFTNAFGVEWAIIIGFMGIGLGSAGNPHIVARYMSINDPRKFKSTAIVGTISNVLMAVGALFTGLAGRIYFPDASMLPFGDTENLYPMLASHHLNPILFGVVISSIFAAIMSTADSQLLVAASALVRDVYEKIFYKGKTVSQSKLVLLSRLMVFILVIVSLILAFVAEDIVFWLVLFAWAGLGAALGPTSILALFWRNTTRNGTMAGIIAGAVTVIIWSRVAYLKSMMYELVPAFFIGLTVTFAVSLITSKAPGNDDLYKRITSPDNSD
jgi:sodium/proline symporter